MTQTHHPRAASWATLSGPIGDEGPEDEYALAVEGLYKRFGDSPELYHDLHLRIRRGTIVVIVGESGIGKSVFLKHLIGLEEASQGAIWYRPPGKHARDWPVHQMSESEMKDIRREVAMVFQASSLFDWMTVQENIALPLQEHHELVGQRLHGYLADPTELMVIMRRARGAAGAFQPLVDRLEAPRRDLAAAHQGLLAALRARPDAALVRAVVNAFGLDAAEGVPAARPGPSPGSPWASASGLLATWSAETLGDLLVPMDADELPAAAQRFRHLYAEVRRALRAAYIDARKAWGPAPGHAHHDSGPHDSGQHDFSDLVALLAIGAAARAGAPPPAPSAALASLSGDADAALARLVEQWASSVALALPGPSASGAERLRQCLCALKTRPTLLAPVLAAAGAQAPASFAALATALAEFGKRRVEIEAELLAQTSGPAGAEAELWRTMMLAWLTVRPMTVDRTKPGVELLAAVVEAFADRPEELGLLLARPAVGGVELAGPLTAFLSAHAAFRAAFESAFRELLARPRDELVEAFTDLVVNGLMAALKLDVKNDREKLPSQLSGGMRTRVGLARSLATLPSVVLYDEPTAGLDPVLSKNIAREILELQTSGIVSTSIVVTHDKDLYQTLKLAGRTRMLYLSSGRFLDLEARPVRDPLRLGEVASPAEPVREPGVRGYPPDVFIEEFEQPDTGEASRNTTG